MKQMLLIGFVLFILSVPGIEAGLQMTPSYSYNDPITGSLEEFNHTVFAEYGATSSCPNYPSSSEALYSIFNSSDYPFYYVSLVASVNPIALVRLWQYQARYVPAVYIDGAYRETIGTAGSPSADEAIYRTLIEESGIRPVARSLEMDISVTWEGNAKLTVTVTIKNNDNLFYFGILRAYVTEIVSRWNNQQGNPFHFGFLDFALKRLVFIGPQKTYTTTATWDGVASHDGQTFEDITADNIMVMATASHWRPGSTKGMFVIARICISNWLWIHPSMVQCPLLCALGASSFTKISSSSVKNISTAKIPTRSRPCAILIAIS